MTNFISPRLQTYCPLSLVSVFPLTSDDLAIYSSNCFLLMGHCVCNGILHIHTEAWNHVKVKKKIHKFFQIKPDVFLNLQNVMYCGVRVRWWLLFVYMWPVQTCSDTGQWRHVKSSLWANVERFEGEHVFFKFQWMNTFNIFCIQYLLLNHNVQA